MKRLAPPLLLVLVALGVAGWMWSRRHHDQPEPAQIQLEEGDTGFSRQATEERMRAIGYVQ